MSDWEKVGMPVRRPQYVDEYLQGIHGPGRELHEDPMRAGPFLCQNPKCLHNFAEDDIGAFAGNLKCPECGWETDLGASLEPRFFEGPGGGKAELNPGGMTRSGLTVGDMGHIGEQIVQRIGELPGIGVITPASSSYNFPIDVVITNARGAFGVEIKTNHSQAQERFKIGGKAERQAKIQYCLQNGLKPALIGVRLNFFTDKAYVFFREGLTDTWVGNSKMLHVGTYDFADLNPFKSPDPESTALAIQLAELPDQSEEMDHTAAEDPKEKDPDYIYVYYGSELHVEPWEHSLRYEDLLDHLLEKFGLDISKNMIDLDPTMVDAGELRQRGDKILVEHRQLNDPEVRKHAEEALTEWWKEKKTEAWFSWEPEFSEQA